jgi:uncharacterized membrane protein YdbT with pleckstrin-like domain
MTMKPTAILKENGNVNIDIDQEKFLTYIKIFLPIYWIPRFGRWWYTMYISRLAYRLDDDCVVCEYGVFFFSKKRVPYKGIRGATVYRGPLLQLFGGSVVKIETAGQNQGYPEISFICASDPEALVKNITQRTIEAKESA